MKNQKSDNERKIKKIASFTLIYKHNIDKLIVSLLDCGYFVKVNPFQNIQGEQRTVDVYTN